MLRTFLFTIVIYFVLRSEFWPLDFAWYYLCATAAAISGSAYGTMISSWIANVDVATTIMIILDLSFLLTAGMFYNLRYVSLLTHFVRRNDQLRGKKNAMAIMTTTTIFVEQCQVT